MSTSLNNVVAIAPIEFNHDVAPQEPVSRLVRTDKMLNKIVKTKALMDGPQGIKAGNTLMFRADVATHPAYRQVHELEGQKIIFVPVELVVARE